MKLLPEAIWLAIEPVDMRTGADGLSLRAAGAGARTMRWDGLRVQQQAPHSPEGGVLQRHWRVDVPATAAPRPVRLAAGRRHLLAGQCRAMAMAGDGR